MKVYILVGLMWSGKSTWAKKFVKEHADTKIVCADLFRVMLNGDYMYLAALDDTITDCMFDAACNLLTNGYNVIIDCGNLTDESDRRGLWKQLPGDKIAVLFPQKDELWHIINRQNNPHGDADLGGIIKGEKKAFVPVDPKDYDEIITVKEF